MSTPNPARKKRPGSSPGTLVHVGRAASEPPVITVIDFTLDRVEETRDATVADCAPLAERESVTWIDVNRVHDVELVRALGEAYSVHSLVLEDIVNTRQRPKLDEFPGQLYIVLKMLHAAPDGDIEVEQLSIVVGSNYVLTFQEKPGDVFAPVRERIRNESSRLRRRGPDYLAYAIIDAVVDHYFPVLESVGDRLEALEEEAMAGESTDILPAIYRVRRDLIFLRKSVWPLREVVSHLRRAETELFTQETQPFLGDVYDHTIYVVETLESYRDMASGLMDMYLSATSNRTNDVMKVLTLIATIFMPLGFLAGVYGMNFEYIPELKYEYGYFVLLGFMATIGGTMLFIFRRRGWL